MLLEVRAFAVKKAGAKRKPAGKKKAAREIKPVDAPAETRKAVRDGQQYIKKELLKELSCITSGMIAKAKGGGTAPLKLLWELGKLHENASSKRKPRQPSLGKLLLEEVRRKQAESRKAEETERIAEAGKQN